jgi:thiosulfate reductase cytochrome b subunit
MLGGFARHYVLSFKDMRSIPAQTTYYIHGHFRGGTNPFKASPSSRFNALQKLAYSFIMFIAMPLIIATGIVFGNIMDFYALISATGGIRVLDIIHVIVGYIFVIYLIVHLYMATLGKHVFSHTKAMITGREE